MVNKYLKTLVEDIHTVIFASSDADGHPITCAIDLMLYDKNGLYFLTAMGKAFYERLKGCPFISLTGIKGEDTMSSTTITLRGEVREIGSERLEEIFKVNPYMADIYPSMESRAALTVFQIYKGSGEFFDLSCRPIFRESFSFGGETQESKIFYITNKCISCKKCIPVCPQECIDINNGLAVIRQNNCLHCGRCEEICPVGAVERRIV